MSPQYGELRLTSGWIDPVVWGTPVNFNRFRILAALLHGTPVAGVSQTLRCWTEGITYIRQGGHHVGQWPTFLVVFYCTVYLSAAAVSFLCLLLLLGSITALHVQIWLNRSISHFGCGLGWAWRKHKFNNIHQEAPLCPHRRAHWRRLVKCRSEIKGL